MKAFIAYRFTGENPDELNKLMSAVCEALKAGGVEAYCTLFDSKELMDKTAGAREIMDHAFSKIDESEFLFVLQTSENKSEGMLMEVGYCVAKNIPIVVASKEGFNNTYLPQMGSHTIAWSDTTDLQEKIRSTNFRKIVGL
ncbi:MAG: nucleoside 2-deoxyribosyltransferase [Candidatus Curtissbacteria bacterium]